MKSLKLVLVGILIVGMIFGVSYYTQSVKGGAIPTNPDLVQIKNDTMSFNVHVLFKANNGKEKRNVYTRVLPGTIHGYRYPEQAAGLEVEIIKEGKSCIRSVSRGDKFKVSMCLFNKKAPF